MNEDFDNIKIPKPTMSQPSSTGGNIDNGFKREFNKIGVDLKSIKEEGGVGSQKTELKKKIFNLSKMETLVMTDNYLSGIFNNLKDSAKNFLGYHWNEALLNIMFNELVLDDVGYLQKYKNTQAYKKKRRGEEGVAELEKNVQDKLSADKQTGAKPTLQRKGVGDISTTNIIGKLTKNKEKLDMTKDKEQDVPQQMKEMTSKMDEEMNELFGFGKPAPLPTHTPSENDMYLVDKKSNTAVGVISPNLNQQQNLETSQKFGDANRYERMSWYSAIQKGAKNVPQMSPEMQAKFSDNKYTTQAYSQMPSYGALKEDGLAEDCNCPPPARNPNDPMASFAKLGETENQEMSQLYTPLVRKAAMEVAKVSNGFNDIGQNLKGVLAKYDITDASMIDSIISKAAMIIKRKLEGNPMEEDVYETTGSASSGQFTQALDATNTDMTYQKENNSNNRIVDNDKRVAHFSGEDDQGNKWYMDDAKNYFVLLKNGINGDGAAGLYAVAPNGEPTEAAVDVIPVNETTTSASSGQFSGPAIWAKSPHNSRWAHKPAWDGGQIITEALKSGEYLTNPDAFKRFVRLHEAVNLLNECAACINEGNPKEDAMLKLKQLKDMLNQYPDLANEVGFQDAVNHQEEIIQNTSQPQPMPFGRPQSMRPTVPTKDATSQWGQPVQPMKEQGFNKNFVDSMKTDLEDTRDNPAAVNKMSPQELMNQENLFKGNATNPSSMNESVIDEKAKSKAEQKFMGMVHATQKGELKNPSAKVAKAAASMSDKDVKDFASTKHKGLPDHVKKDKKKVDENFNDNDFDSPEDNIKQKHVYNPAMNAKVKPVGNARPVSKEVEAFNQLLKTKYGVDSVDQLNGLQRRDLFNYIKANPIAAVQPKGEVAPEFNNPDISNQTMGADDPDVVAEDNVEATGQPVNPIQPQNVQSDNVFVELGKMLFPFDKGLPDTEFELKAKNFINQDSRTRGKDPKMILTAIKKAAAAMGGVFESGKFTSSPPAAQQEGNSFQGLEEAFDQHEYHQVKSMLDEIKGKGEMRNLRMYLDEKGRQDIKDWTLDNMGDMGDSMGVDETMADGQAQPDSMVNTPETSMANAGNSDELNSTGEPLDTPTSGSNGSGMDMPDDENMKPMNESFGKKKLSKNKQKAQDNILKQLKKETAEGQPANMYKKAKMSESEYLSTDKNKTMNEERQTNSILNLEKIKKETAALTNKEMAQADALKQAKVYPEPKDFYIEQDIDKVQSDAKTGEELEKEALQKIKDKQEALKNVGNSTNDNGNEIVKRNLTKEEMLKLAMDRGDGMHNIVYDNEPAKRFEDRMKKDMGDDQYKLRQEKLDYREDMPMYNKDTQPTEGGEKKEQFDKFKQGFNESYAGKYFDDNGKIKIVEFELKSVKEVTSVDKDATYLSLEGMGNKYTQKINENAHYEDLIKNYDFYLDNSNNIVKIATTKEEPKEVISEGFKKMQHLIDFDSKTFVDNKRSVKF